MRFPILKKSREEIEKIQLTKIKRILMVAYEKSDFYHQFYFNRDFHPDMVKSYEDIKKIPIVKRAMLKNTPTESILTNKNISSLHLHTTSGSSGIPVKYYYTTKEDLKKNYGVLRAYMMMGMRLTDKTIAFRDPIDITKPTLYQKMGIVSYDYYNIYTPMVDLYNNICSNYSSIDVLKGMPSDLISLCHTIRKGNKKFPKVRLLISDSEVLDDFSREYISDTLNKNILDFYGSVENGCIAFQMEGSDKYFLNEDQVLVENSQLGDMVGDVIISNLRNTTFPIIRYQIGDMADFGDGKSDLEGVNLKTIKKVHGKYLDFIVLPDHTIVSPHVPKQELTHIDGIKKFQIVQKDYDQIIVKIERDNNYNEGVEKTILNSLNKAFENKVKCLIEYDDTLSKKTKNKFKCIQSDIAQSFLSDMYK